MSGAVALFKIAVCCRRPGSVVRHSKIKGAPVHVQSPDRPDHWIPYELHEMSKKQRYIAKFRQKLPVMVAPRVHLRGETRRCRLLLVRAIHCRRLLFSKWLFCLGQMRLQTVWRLAAGFRYGQSQMPC